MSKRIIMNYSTEPMSHSENIELEYRCKSKLTIAKKSGSELLTFSLPLFGIFEIYCIVTIPAEGETSAPVYVKVRRKQKPRFDKHELAD
jgi:hypothetical protein